MLPNPRWWAEGDTGGWTVLGISRYSPVGAKLPEGARCGDWGSPEGTQETLNRGLQYVLNQKRSQEMGGDAWRFTRKCGMYLDRLKRTGGLILGQR